MARSNAEQSAHTRATLIAVATRLFAEYGYNGTSTHDIVTAAGVTRGALYHHFVDKRGLFKAVFLQLREQRIQEIRTRLTRRQGDLWERLVTNGCRTFLELTLDAGEQRIISRDGPAVLDVDIWYPDAPGVRLIQESLDQLIAAGHMTQTLSTKTLAHLLWGAFLEAERQLTYAADKAHAKEEVVRGLQSLFAGLRA